MKEVSSAKNSITVSYEAGFVKCKNSMLVLKSILIESRVGSVTILELVFCEKVISIG